MREPRRARTRAAMSSSLLALAMLALGPATTQAETFTVDITGATPAGACTPGTGPCSLRAAIIAANGLAGPDTIVVPAGTFRLTHDGPLEDLAETGDLDITDDLTLTGSGAAATFIEADGNDRVFHILGEPTVLISGVTIRNGSAGTGGNIFSDRGNGGGILNNGGPSGHLTLEDCVVSGNTAAPRATSSSGAGDARRRRSLEGLS